MKFLFLNGTRGLLTIVQGEIDQYLKKTNGNFFFTINWTKISSKYVSDLAEAMKNWPAIAKNAGKHKLFLTILRLQMQHENTVQDTNPEFSLYDKVNKYLLKCEPNLSIIKNFIKLTEVKYTDHMIAKYLSFLDDYFYQNEIELDMFTHFLDEALLSAFLAHPECLINLRELCDKTWAQFFPFDPLEMASETDLVEKYANHNAILFSSLNGTSLTVTEFDNEIASFTMVNHK